MKLSSIAFYTGLHLIILCAFSAAFLPRSRTHVKPMTIHHRASFQREIAFFFTSLCATDEQRQQEEQVDESLEKLRVSSSAPSRPPTASTRTTPSEEPPATIPTLKRKKNSRMVLFSKLSLPIVEIVSAGAVLLSSLLVALDTLDNLSPVVYAAITDALLALNLLFALDFFLRWYAAGQFKAIYLTKPLVVIDIVVILIPLFLDVVLPLLDAAGVLQGDAIFYGWPNSAGLQNLLLLRVLRLRRVLTDIGTFRRFAGALGLRSKDVRPYQLQLARVILSIFTLLSVSTGLIYTAEHDVNPLIPDYFTALYFGLTTLTTVGYGDITPVTFQGRLVVCCSIIAGVAIIPAQAAKIVDSLIQLQREQKPDPLSASTTKRRRKTVAGRTANVERLTDGKGPSGIPIEDPIMEWNADGKRNDNIRIDSLLTCKTCQAAHHWSDAIFCWSCGSELDRDKELK